MGISNLKENSITYKMSKEYELSKFLELLEENESQCYVYVLQLRDGTFYTGLTSRPAKRYIEHQVGNSISTKFKRPVNLITLLRSDNRSSARLLEKRVKANGAERILIGLQTAILLNDPDIIYYKYAGVELSRRKEYKMKYWQKEREKEATEKGNKTNQEK